MADGQRAGLHCREDRAFATDIGLKPLTTPVRSPQNGMAERFVKTMKRDDVAFMPKPDAATTVCSAHLAIAFEHDNEPLTGLHSCARLDSPAHVEHAQPQSTMRNIGHPRAVTG
ncbi:IS3 family transposase [Ralstonia solanacearum]